MNYIDSDILSATIENSDRSILIVDDTPLICELLSANLDDIGYQTTSVHDGAQALELIAINNFDIVLLDVVMPGLNGIGVLQKIRQRYNFIELPVIMITAIDGSEEIVKTLDAGANDYVTKPFDIPVIIARVKTHLALKTIAEELKQKNQLLQEISTIDELTSIPNRRYLNQYLKHEWERAIRYKTALSIIFIDVDFFKNYNDTYRHQAGDECLKKIALALKFCIKRQIDLVARYGGEEFIVVLPDTDKVQAVTIAESIRAKVEEINITHKSSNISNHVTISAGVMVAYPKQDEKYLSLIEKADQCLYKAKQQGRNRVVSD